MNNTLYLIDKVIRGIALISLVPFALFALFMSLLATDSPSNGILPGYIALAAFGIIGGLIFYSSTQPERLSKPFSKLGDIANIIGRLPAYSYAPFGFYYGGRIILNVVF